MRTFSVDLEKRTGRLPVIEYAAFKEPLCGSLVTESTRNIMARGWVWWREPFAKVLPQLVVINVAHNFQNLSSSHPSLLVCQLVQPLQRIFDIHPSN